MIKDSFELFEEDFKDGDEVIIVNDSDLFDWGILSFDEKGFTLSSGIRPRRSYTWHQCVFMAKDGFPVRKIFGRFPKGEDITNKQIYLRAGLALELIEDLKEEVIILNHLLKNCTGRSPKKLVKLIENIHNEIKELEKPAKFMDRYYTPTVHFSSGDDTDISSEDDNSPSTSIRFGCPFETDMVSIQLYNPWGIGDQFSLTAHEETLRMKHKNGTVAQLWQLTEIFDFGI